MSQRPDEASPGRSPHGGSSEPEAALPASRSSAALRRAVLVMVALVLLLAASCVFRLFVGEPSLESGYWLSWPDGSIWAAVVRMYTGDLVVHSPITVMDLRVFRLVAAVLVGASLAGSGVSLQALLRNPLAEPFILGLSTGAVLGVVVQLLVAHVTTAPMGPLHIGALVGAAGAMAIVFAAARRHRVIDPLGLLLVGVVVSTINGALITVLAYLAPLSLRDQAFRWGLGFINEGVGPVGMISVTVVAVVGLVVLVVVGRAMDVSTFSDAEAKSMGLPLERMRLTLFLAASGLAAGAVVLAGPIAFVGLICPHVVRLMLGPGHRGLVVGAALVGAMLILWADMASILLDVWNDRGRMPIGIFTALLGGPVFLWMLRPYLGRGLT